MTQQVEAIYEHGVFRPLEPVDVKDKQHVRLTINEPKGDDPLADLLDIEFMERCRRQKEEAPGIEEARRILSKIPGSLAEDIIAAREDR